MIGPVQRDESVWAYVLPFAAFLLLALGVWAALQSHRWTALWPLNVLGGIAAYIPMALWLRFGPGLPQRRLILWPARALALILTVVIPFVVWGPVPNPPPPAQLG